MSRKVNGHDPDLELGDATPEDVIRLLVMIIRMVCQTEGIDPRQTCIRIDQKDEDGSKEEVVNMPLEKILVIAATYF